MINTSKKLPGPFLIDLKNKFREIAGEDQLIDRSEFQDGLDIVNREISDRLFDIFDKDKSGAIDYNEFMDTIDSIIAGTESEKIRFAFDLHDLDDSGFIDRDELKLLIEQSFLENSLDYDEFQLDLLVDEFFKRADKDHSGTIDFNEFLDVAHEYPDFIEGFAVNPVNWLVPDRYEASERKDQGPTRNFFKSSIQVQDIGLFQWLLIPRLIFLYNVVVNRKKNRSSVGLQSIHLLPSKILELTISAPDGFRFTPGDYLYINCAEISTMEWYPFNIIRHTEEGDLVLHVKSNNRWADKLYDATIKVIGRDTSLNWQIRMDGPYGSSSRKILDTEHAILVGEGHGISRMAPILQDIVMRLKNHPEQIKMKRLDLFWLINDQSYFEWFTKMLNDIDAEEAEGFFNYHIYFMDKKPEDMTDKMMYISTNVTEKQTNVTLIDNLWGKSSFGLPDWTKELGEIRSEFSHLQGRLFYSGPIQTTGPLKKECKNLGISFKRGAF